MARTVRDAKFESREARSKLKVSGKPYYRAIDPGLHLGYRKGKTGGKWVARWYVGDQDYRVQTLEGIADDRQDADGAAVLSFAQAQAKARELYLAAKRGGSLRTGPLTVQQACEAYVEYLRAEKKTADDAESRLKLHVYGADRPVEEMTEEERAKELARRALRGKTVSALTSKELDKWKWGMVRKDEDDLDAERRSKDTANRVLTMLKAALNRAFEDTDNEIPNDIAWRRVKPFRAVGRARQVHLDVAQSNRLINRTKGAFRNLVTAALLTGARAPHELAAAKVRDFHAELGQLSVDGKTGLRDITLTKEAIHFFEGLAAGKAPEALLLPKDDGTAWGKNHHVRMMQEAVKKAKLPKDTTIYSLRHTYASQSILGEINLKLLAENMGTSIRMLEQHYAKFLAAAKRELVEEAGFKLGLKPGNVRRMGARA